MSLSENPRSCTTARTSSEHWCSKQRHTRTGGRHLFRCPTGGYKGAHLYIDILVPTGMRPSSCASGLSNNYLDSSRQGVVQPRLLGYLCRCDHPLRLCIIPLWLACTWESHSPHYHSIQSHRPQGPSLLQRLPTSGSCGPCLTLPAIVYSCRIPPQDYLYSPVVGAIPLRLRPSSTCPRAAPNFHIRPTFAALFDHFYSFDYLLFPGAPVDLRVGPARVPTIDVHEQLLCPWSCRKLGWVYGGLFYSLDLSN